jgi:CRP-like cAMP-binding protein
VFFNNLLEKGEIMVSPGELQSCGFFRDFPDSFLAPLANLCQEETFQDEERIFREGEEATKVYILMEGTVTLQMQLKQHHHVIVGTIEERGELFGWSALVASKRYGASVQCLGKSSVLSLKGEALEKLFEDNPLLGLHFMKKIAGLIDRRLIALRQRLVSSLS